MYSAYLVSHHSGTSTGRPIGYVEDRSKSSLKILAGQVFGQLSNENEIWLVDLDEPTTIWFINDAGLEARPILNEGHSPITIDNVLMAE